MSSTPGSARQQMRSPNTGGASSSSSSSILQQQQQQRKEASSFTSEMCDRQSRGKDPYTKERPTHGDLDDDDDDMDMDDDDEEEDDEDEDMGMDGSRMRLGGGPKNEGFEEREKRQFALAVLDSPEQLMMYAQSTNDSIPGQRYRFMSALCGFHEGESRQGGRVQRR